MARLHGQSRSSFSVGVPSFQLFLLLLPLVGLDPGSSDSSQVFFLTSALTIFATAPPLNIRGS